MSTAQVTISPTRHALAPARTRDELLRQGLGRSPFGCHGVHSGFAPENFTTLAQRLISLCTKAPELLGRIADGDGALGFEAALHLGLPDGMTGRVADLSRPLGRHVRRSEEAEPCAGFVARQHFRDSLNVRECGQPLRCRDAQRLQLAGLDVLLHIPHRGKHQLHLAGKQVLHGRRSAAIGNVHDLHARLHLEGLARHVQRGAYGPDREVELTRLGLGECDQFLHVVRRHRGMRDQDRR